LNLIESFTVTSSDTFAVGHNRLATNGEKADRRQKFEIANNCGHADLKEIRPIYVKSPLPMCIR